MIQEILANNKQTAVALMVAMITVCLFSAVASPVFAQSSMEGSATVMYKSAYSKMAADSNNRVTVQTEHHLYKPGEQVRIHGSMSSEAREEARGGPMQVNIMDASGSVIAEERANVESNGEYSATFTLPANAKEGGYTIDSKIDIDVTTPGVDVDILVNLQSQTTFVVASSSEFEVTAEEQDFTVDIASNSNVNSFAFAQAEKKVSFKVDGETGTTGVTQITIPKAMLSGDMTVAIDGQVVTSESEDVIIVADTEAETTLEINYSHSEHDVAVSGTNVVPEFPLATLVMAGAVGSIIAALAIAKKKGFGSWS